MADRRGSDQKRVFREVKFLHGGNHLRLTGKTIPHLTKYSQVAQVLNISVKVMRLEEHLNLNTLGDRIKYARLLRGTAIRGMSIEKLTLELRFGWCCSFVDSHFFGS